MFMMLHIPVTLVWVATINNGVPFGVQNAWLSISSTGCPLEVFAQWLLLLVQCGQSVDCHIELCDPGSVPPGRGPDGQVGHALGDIGPTRRKEPEYLSRELGVNHRVRGPRPSYLNPLAHLFESTLAPAPRQGE